MFRYLIIVGDPQSASDTSSIDGVRRRLQKSPSAWQSVEDHPGFYAAYVDNRIYAKPALLLHNQRGVIFGKVYPSPEGADAGPPKPMRSLSQVDSEDIVRSRGKSLISRYWGYYVAAIRCPEMPSVFVLRSPVSPLACFHIRLGTLSIFFSYLDDCMSLKLTTLSINWDSITAQVVGGDYLTHETAINEINTLECGESVECTPASCMKHVYWDPRCFLRDRRLNSFPEASRAIRETVDYSVNALSCEHEHVLVNLSGGLDSSIVMSALGRCPHKPMLTAVNYHSRGCGDERPYARCMARSVDCRLVERPRNDRLDLRRFFDCNTTVRPVLNFSAPDVEARNTALARELGATAIFNGELGDNVFGRTPSPGILLECIRRNGFGRRFLSVAMDFAMITNQSIWQTLALTCREYQRLIDHSDFGALQKLQGRYGVEGARSLMLASADAEQHHKSMRDRFLHPWLKRARGLAPDSHKLLFGLVVVTSPSCHSPFAAPDDPPQMSPLISQPVVETALQIPGYLHCRSAQDRAVARAAFADTLPTEILDRGLGKGGPDLWAKDVVENNSRFLQDFLLDGILVKRGLLDRKKVESALSPRIVKSTAMVGDIFAKLYIEAWVRTSLQWETPRT